MTIKNSNEGGQTHSETLHDGQMVFQDRGSSGS